MQIADFLSKASPNGSKNTPRRSNETAAVDDERRRAVEQDWEADVRAFDQVYEHTLHMADALSDGIVKQVPNTFS